MFHDPDFPVPQIGLFPRIRGPGGDLVQLWLGPRLCSPRSQAGPTISTECAVCGAGRPTSWNTFPSAGIASRRMGPESIQRAPCPTCGNTEPRGGVTRPAEARPPADQPTARRTATAPAATDEAGRPRRPRRNPPRLSKICDAEAGPFLARRPGRRRPCPLGSGVRGGSRGWPSTEPRTVATERAQYGHPTVPAFDLSHCPRPSWSQSAPPTKATPAPMPGVTVTEGAQPRGTVGVSGRSPTGAEHLRCAVDGDPSPGLDPEGSWPAGSPN